MVKLCIGILFVFTSTVAAERKYPLLNNRAFVDRLVQRENEILEKYKDSRSESKKILDAKRLLESNCLDIVLQDKDFTLALTACVKKYPIIRKTIEIDPFVEQAKLECHNNLTKMIDSQETVERLRLPLDSNHKEKLKYLSKLLDLRNELEKIRSNATSLEDLSLKKLKSYEYRIEQHAMKLYLNQQQERFYIPRKILNLLVQKLQRNMRELIKRAYERTLKTSPKV